MKDQSCLALVYDILGQIISVLDVTTDVIVCVQYYQNDRMVFFGISLTILLLALIAYDIVFMMNYCDERKLYKQIALFLTMLPISPLIPYILYLTVDSDSILSKCLDKNCCFELGIYNRIYKDKNTSKLRQFMEEKVMKHLGFIVEALVEGKYSVSHFIIKSIFHPCTYFTHN